MPPIIHRAGQLPDLFPGQKLRLVDEDASDRSEGETGRKFGKKISPWRKSIRRLANADAAGNAAVACTIVKLCIGDGVISVNAAKRSLR